MGGILLFDFSGGILGWDPVHTTCIPDEMMMRWWEYYERSYKNIMKIIQLCFDKEFCLYLIRMMILLKNVLLRVILWNFVRKVVRCDASNRLLRNTSHDDPMWVMRSFVHLGDVHELSSLTRIHVVSTGSHPKIPPEKSQTTKPTSWRWVTYNKL